MGIDVLWREERVVAEADGHALHRMRRALEHDHRRTVDRAASL